ncbi:MAG: nucleotide exchange factor GrpE [Planctomycetes bacterium]|nr:nucleotide exchange factor GrpE [Planctomycetota bacterium]
MNKNKSKAETEKDAPAEEQVADGQNAADECCPDGDCDVADQEEVEVEEEVPDEDIVVSARAYEKLQTDNRELREQLMRQQAEFENTRRRLRKTADEAGVRSLARFVRQLLSEMDNFELAIQNAHPEKFTDFAMGVTMTYENIKNIFSGSGVTVVKADGIFDPALHEVVAEIEDDDKPRGTILEVQRNGYQLNEQVVRAAQVIVSKPVAPPVEEKAETEEVAEKSAEDAKEVEAEESAE